MGVLLVGTDFSKRSEQALRRAILLSKESGYDLLLVHVTQKGSTAIGPDGAADPEKLLQSIKHSVSEVDGVPCQTSVRNGAVATELGKAAVEADARLIIIGPHRKAGLWDWFKGSTAENLVLQSATPLLVVNAEPANPWRLYLLPVDFGPASRRAVEVTTEFPFLTQSRLMFAHVYDAVAREMLGRAFVQGDEREAYLEGEARTARLQLRNFVAELGHDQAELVVQEIGGNVADGLERIIRDEGTDLVIVSRSNKGVAERVFLGSVTEALLRKGSQDILVIP